MMIAHDLHLRRRILRLITLEHDPTVAPGNEHLATADAGTVGRMISPDIPAQIVLSEVSRSTAIERLGQSDVERPRYQGRAVKRCSGLQQGRVGHALGAEPSAWHHDASIGFAWIPIRPPSLLSSCGTPSTAVSPTTH